MIIPSSTVATRPQVFGQSRVHVVVIVFEVIAFMGQAMVGAELQLEVGAGCLEARQPPWHLRMKSGQVLHFWSVFLNRISRTALEK